MFLFRNYVKYFFEEFLKESDIATDDFNKIYKLAKKYGITSHFGNDESKNYEIFRFYYLNKVLYPQLHFRI